MDPVIDIEKQILALPALERERLATFAWESLANDQSVAGNRYFDPEGLELARQRDAEIEAGVVKTIDHAEFLRRTDGSMDKG